MSTNNARTKLRKEHGELRTFVRWLLLKPYGNDLIAPQTRMWLLLARLVVATMAAAEATAWSYISYNIADDVTQRVVAGIVGAVVFFIIAAIDTTFLTHDISGSRYDIAPDPEGTGRWRVLKRIISSKTIGVLLRMGMVLGSLVITSPYLAQLALRKDVIATIVTQNKKAITDARRSVERSFDLEAARLKATIDSLQKQSIDEAAGIGPSKKKGRGSTVRTIEARLENAQSRAAALNEEKERKLAEFDKTPPSEIARRYGVRFLGEGIQSRSEVVKQLEEMPGYSGVRVPIYGFLIGIFLAIFALKLFQPRTARIYFSEQLQDAYVAYRSGLYDDLLPEKERSTLGFEIPPVRFEHWWTTSEVIRQRAAAFNAEASQEENRQRVTEEAISDMERRVGARMKPQLEQRQKVDEELSQLEDEKREQEAAVVALRGHVEARRIWIQSLDANLTSLEANLHSDADVETLTRLVRVKTNLVKEIAKAASELATSQIQLIITEADIATARQQSDRLGKIIDEQAAALADAARRRTAAHKEHLDEIDTLRRRYRGV